MNWKKGNLFARNEREGEIIYFKMAVILAVDLKRQQVFPL